MDPSILASIRRHLKQIQSRALKVTSEDVMNDPDKAEEVENDILVEVDAIRDCLNAQEELDNE